MPKKMHVIIGAALVAACIGAQSARAGVILSDNFNSDLQTLNWPGDSVFTSNTTGNASVDLIGGIPGPFFDLYPGHGNYVDLDGTTGSGNSPAGRLDSIGSFGPGTYTLTFLLGGSQRGGINGDVGNTTEIVFGSFFKSISLSPTDPLNPYTYTFTTTGGTLSFIDPGPSNQIGNVLDDVTLSVPEPATWTLLLLGLGGLGYASFRRNRKKASAAFAVA
jgi:hypothetical protein